MLDKTQRMNELLDWYAELLTEKQREAAYMHYREDFSLSEIAEHTHSSRSAVHETIQRVDVLMEDYENKLQCVQRYKQRVLLYTQLSELKNESVDMILKQLLDLE